MEAKVNIRIGCGCGFKTTSIVEATTHSEKTGHSLFILGEIKKE